MPLYIEDTFVQKILSSQDGALMGLDLGTKRIGVALSDKSWTIANPLENIQRINFKYVLEDLKKKIKDFSIIGIIVGLPLHMNGTQGRAAQSARHFVYNLMKEIDLPTLLWDERLSTFAAEEALLKADLSRAKRILLRDKIAAAIILQSFLNKIYFLQNHQRGLL